MSSGAPRPASTVVLLRPGPDGPETFLVRRHGDIAFMAGAHVFPGGRVDAADADTGYESLADGTDAAIARMTDIGRDAARAHCIAAIRETFEEAGVMLARDGTGSTVELSSADATAARATRNAVSRSAANLLTLLHTRRWRLALDSLVYVAHWVTPQVETRRFDTRFFLAAAPPQQDASHDEGETIEGVWLRPADAIAQCRAGTIALPPPTWTTLRWLEPCASVDAALEWARERRVPRIQPKVVREGESRVVILPGDRSMPRVPGFEAADTRFVLSAGRWTPVA